MSLEKNILVKLNNVGIQQNEKWLVKGVSLEVEKGKILDLMALEKVLPQKLHWEFTKT